MHATPRTKRPTIGAEVAKIAGTFGPALMPWQKRVIDTAGELNPDGTFVHPEIVLTVPRQCGKTTLVRAAVVHALNSTPGTVAVYLAQSGPAGRSWWRELGRSLHRSKWAQSFAIRHALGDELLTWGNSSTVAMLPPTESAGHGMTIDRAFADEIWRQKDFRLPQALLPAQITRPRRQTWWISTAGTDESALMLSLLEQSRATVDDPDAAIALFEWAAPLDADPTKRRTWRMANPALGHTIPVAAVQHAFNTMELTEFRRAFLNQWVDRGGPREVDAGAWARAAVELSPLTPGEPVWLAFDIAPGRDGAAIAAAGRLEQAGDQRFGIELVEYHEAGHTIPARVLDLVGKHRPVKVVADGAGPAGTVVDAIADKLGDRLEVLNARQYARSCQAFADGLAAGELAITTAPELDTAAAAAAKRVLGDGWAWGRSRSGADISPLVAATLALNGARLHDPRPKPKIRVRS